MSFIELNPRRSQASSSSAVNPDDLLRTLTGEPFQFVRLYGKIHNLKIWQGRFRRLKSIQYQADQDVWLWRYCHEAEVFEFPLTAKAVAKPYRPAILATMVQQGDDLVITLHSSERAIAMATFLMEKLNRRVFELNRFRVVNRFYSRAVSTNPESDQPDELRLILDEEALFNPSDLRVLSDEKFEAQVKEIAAQYDDEAERMAAINQFLEAESQRPTPSAEDLPFHGYDEGIDHLMLMLQMRQVVTFEHWKGNTNFTQMDAINRAMDLNNAPG